MDSAAEHRNYDLVKFLHFNRNEGCSVATMDVVMEHGDYEMAKWLFENRPEGFSYRAICSAAKAGELEMVQWLCERRKIPLPPHCMDVAATHNQLEIVQWFYDNPQLYHKQRRQNSSSSDAIDGAAANGHLAMVKWLYANRKGNRKGGRCTDNALIGAAMNGKLPVVEYLLENVQPKKDQGFDFSAIDRAIEAAVKEGHLSIVAYLAPYYVRGLSDHPDQLKANLANLLEAALLNGHLEVANYFQEENEVVPDMSWMITLAHDGRLDSMHWLYNHIGSITFNSFDFRKVLLRATTPTVVKWLYKTAFFSNLETYRALCAAIGNGHLQLVKLLYEQLSVMDVTICTTVTMTVRDTQDTHRNNVSRNNWMDIPCARGYLEVVQFLHENSGSEGATTAAMDKAAENGHLSIVKFLHEHRTEGCTSMAMVRAAENGHLSVVQFLHEQMGRQDMLHLGDAILKYVDVVKYVCEKLLVVAMDEDMLTKAAKLGSVKLLHYLHRVWPGEKVIEDRGNSAAKAAALAGDLETLEWLHDHGCSLENTSKFAAEYGHLHILKFLHEIRDEDLFRTFRYLDCSDGLILARRSGHTHILDWVRETFIGQQDIVRRSMCIAILTKQDYYSCRLGAKSIIDYRDYECNDLDEFHIRQSKTRNAGPPSILDQYLTRSMAI